MTLGLPWQAVGIRPLKWKIPARQEEGQATRCEARIFSKIPCSVRSAAESWVPKDLHQESRSLVGRRYCTALPCPGPRSSRAGWPAVQGTLQCGWHPDRGAGLAQELPTESCANATPHVAQNTSNRSSAINGCTTRHSGYAASQRFRKRDRGMLRRGQGHRREAQEPLYGTREAGLPVRADPVRLQHWFACAIWGRRHGDGKGIEGSVCLRNRFFERNWQPGGTRPPKMGFESFQHAKADICLLYTSPSPRDSL